MVSVFFFLHIDFTCYPDTTESLLYGSYNWTESNPGQTAVQECKYGAHSGTGAANVTRDCMSGGTWSEPDFSACRDGSSNTDILIAILLKLSSVSFQFFLR